MTPEETRAAWKSGQDAARKVHDMLEGWANDWVREHLARDPGPRGTAELLDTLLLAYSVGYTDGRYPAPAIDSQPIPCQPAPGPERNSP